MEVPATLAVLPWADPVIDPIGHDPRSRYVELFWLGVLGPTATTMLDFPLAGALTPDGGVVAYWSNFDDPVQGTGEGRGGIFVHDRVAGTTPVQRVQRHPAHVDELAARFGRRSCHDVCSSTDADG